MRVNYDKERLLFAGFFNDLVPWLVRKIATFYDPLCYRRYT